MKLSTLFENKDKKPNPMAKALSDPKFKPKTEIDKKKEAKKGYQKHKGKVEEAGYQGEVEPAHHDFKNVNLDSIKKIIADRNLKADAEEVDGAIRVHTYDADRKSVAKSLGISETMDDEEVDKFHKELDKVIHKHIGHSSDEKKHMDNHESVDPPRYDMDAKRELAQEIYNNSEYYQSEYEDWEAFMNSDDFEEENDRLRSKFGESKIKPYVSMYTDDETGKMWYDVLDSDGKSAFKTKDKKAAMGFFNKNFDALRKGFDSMKEFDGPDETQPNTEPTQNTTPQKGPDDTRLQTNVSLQQVANLFPGVENKQVFLQSLLRLKQGQKISMQHAYTLADAFKELLSKDPQDTQQAMIQLKKINTAESFSSLDKTLTKTYTSDDAPSYPHKNKTMHQGKTPEQALKDERIENFDELDRIKKLAGLIDSEKE